MTNRILIVDDDEASLLLLKTYLSEVSDEICALSDSAQVEAVFAQFEPDIVLLDLHMDDPDGLEILRRLRSPRESLGYLPVLVVTGEMAGTSRISALILGADEFITKPYDRTELVHHRPRVPGERHPHLGPGAPVKRMVALPLS